MTFSKFLDSNRTGHITAAIATGTFLTAIALHYQSPKMLTAAITVPTWELMATMDMDHDSRPVSGSLLRRVWVGYWYVYQQLVGHRSRFSHSLLIGNPCRWAYVLAPWILVWVIHSGVSFEELQKLPTDTLFWVWVGSLVADTVHLAKDGYLRYGVKGILTGKD